MVINVKFLIIWTILCIIIFSGLGYIYKIYQINTTQEIVPYYSCISGTLARTFYNETDKKIVTRLLSTDDTDPTNTYIKCGCDAKQTLPKELMSK